MTRTPLLLFIVVATAAACETPDSVGSASAEVALTAEVEVLVDGLSQPYGLASDALSLYWFDLATGEIQRAPKAGGAAVTLATGAAPCTVWATAEDAANLYWADCGDDSMRIRRLSKYGGSPVTIATRPSHFSVLTVDARHVYWSEHDDIVRVSKYGGAASVVASAPQDDRGISSIAIDGEAFYYAESFSAAGLAPGTIWRTSRLTGQRTALATDARASGLAAGTRCAWIWWVRRCATDLYWAEVGAGELRTVPGTGGPVQTVAAEPTAALLADLELAGDDLYWSASGSFVEPGGVFRTALGTGEVETLARFTSISGLELDADYVYFAALAYGDDDVGSILRVAR